ncbi:transcription factor bHLH68-like [Typha angustifolia]|uniref:transcription factor bHLH68-like n=1 Tax=Typha angustifolia TaxID=59011 RepID=UPI003C2EEE29
MVGFMEEEEEEEGQMEEGSSFLEMLGSGEEEGHLLCLLTSLNSSPSSSAYSFGEDGEKKAFPLHGVPPRKSSDSSSPTSTTTSAPKPSKKKVDKLVATRKKPKTEGYGAHGTAATTKVRKEKLGERIMALQQLVSPFGKTDTASVLHEALGYIRFLHDQVQVLSSPYLQRLPSSAHLQGGIVDLRSRGLCLVPVSCTEHVANTNGADLWSPTIGSSKSSIKH